MNKVLTAYFSASGVTARVAREISEAVGSDLYEIAPKEPYTESDLDWRDENSRSSVEMKDPACRPEIAVPVKDMDTYDTVFLGYPNWWSDVPRAIVTFIEQNKVQLEGKTIVPFVSHGGGGEALTTNTIKKLLPSTTHVLEPYVVYYKNVNDIQELEQWLDQVKVQLQSSNN